MLTQRTFAPSIRASTQVTSEKITLRRDADTTQKRTMSKTSVTGRVVSTDDAPCGGGARGLAATGVVAASSGDDHASLCADDESLQPRDEREALRRLRLAHGRATQGR